MTYDISAEVWPPPRRLPRRGRHRQASEHRRAGHLRSNGVIAAVVSRGGRPQWIGCLGQCRGDVRPVRTPQRNDTGRLESDTGGQSDGNLPGVVRRCPLCGSGHGVVVNFTSTAATAPHPYMAAAPPARADPGLHAFTGTGVFQAGIARSQHQPGGISTTLANSTLGQNARDTTWAYGPSRRRCCGDANAILGDASAAWHR